MSRDLTDQVHEAIKALCSQGDALAEAGRFTDAVTRYTEALDLVPDPKWEWEAATWIHTAIGDAHYLAGDYQSAWAAFRDAMLCPDALGNPFIRLRRGQVYFELGQFQQAEQELASAYMLAGEEIFQTEDRKYADFILPKLRKPETKA